MWWGYVVGLLFWTLAQKSLKKTDYLWRQIQENSFGNLIFTALYKVINFILF